MRTWCLLLALPGMMVTPSALGDNEDLDRARRMIERGRILEAGASITTRFRASPDDPQARYLWAVCELMKVSKVLRDLATQEGNPYQERAQSLLPQVEALQRQMDRQRSGGAPGPEELTWESLQRLSWWRLGGGVAISPDDRYLAWIPSTAGANGAPPLRALDLASGEAVRAFDTLQSTDWSAGAVYFAPGADGILVAAGADLLDPVCRVFHLPTRSAVLAAGMEYRPPHQPQKPGDRVDAFRCRSPRALDASGRIIAVYGGALYYLQWLTSSVPDLTRWVAEEQRRWGSRSEPMRMGLPLGIAAVVELREGDEVWSLDGPASTVLVCSQRALVLVPVGRKLPSGEHAVRWALVDVSSAEAPTLRGFVKDWLSETRPHPIYGHDTLLPGRQRVYVTDVPMYAGGRSLLVRTKAAGLAVTDLTGRAVRRSWSEAELKDLEIVLEETARLVTLPDGRAIGL